MPEVPAIKTPLSPEGLRDALRAGHASVFGTNPSYERLGVAWAQCALETAQGAAVYNYNVGNLKCPPSCQTHHDYARIPTTNPNEYVYQAAYPGPVEGAASYWRLIRESYQQALPFFDDGDPYGAIFALYNEGNYPSYFQTPPEVYARATTALYTKFISSWPKHRYDPSQPYDSERLGERHGGWIVLAGALAAAATAWYVLTRKEITT